MITKLIYDSLENLRAVSGSSAKCDILKNCNPEVLVSFKIALCAKFIFGISVLPDYELGDRHLDMDELKEVLRICRNSSGTARLQALARSLEGTSPETKHVIERILNKDLKCGVAQKTFSKATGIEIETFDVMKGESISKDGQVDFSRVVFPCVVEEKYDGWRVTTIKNGDSITCLSSDGKFIHPPVALVEGLVGCPDGVYDGEVVHESKNYNMVAGIVGKDEVYQDSDFSYMVFAYLPQDKFQLSSKQEIFGFDTKSVSKATTEALANATGVVKKVRSLVAKDESEVRKVMGHVLSKNGEGVMIKNFDQLYHRRRVAGWFKWKFEDYYDARITGFKEGTGKHKGSLGAFVVEYNGVEVEVGGSFAGSLTDENRKLYWEQRETLTDNYVRVIACGVTSAGSLRHPRLVNFHEGKQ